MRARLWIALAGAQSVLAMGCSLLGSPGSQPEGLPHGGTGPFRDTTVEETGVAVPSGAIVGPGEEAMERAMVVGGMLFYSAAAPIPAMPMPDGGMPDDGGVMDDAGVTDAGAIDAGAMEDDPAPDVDWSAHRPRRILRSAGRPENLGFATGTVVLEADATWEGGWVGSPWAIATDGGALLYYQAEGGIGVARAGELGGAFARVGDAPILAASGSEIPAHPTVIDASALEGEDARFQMFFERGGLVRRATSDDGLEWTDAGPIAIPAMPERDERDSPEVRLGAPGAVVVRTEAGRSVLRLYYESHRMNGTVLLGMVASTDAREFEALGRPVVLERDRRRPTPFALDTRITLLMQWAPRSRGRSVRGVLMGSVAPGGASVAGTSWP